MWFKRSRKSKIENRSEFVGLPSIPDPIDDNLYLASAVKAAIVDKESGAYDEFLFSENGISKMPFEESLDAHLGLVSFRVADQGRRELLIRQQRVLEGKSRIVLAGAAVERAKSEVAEARSRIEYQVSILEGSREGKDNLIWKDSIPEFTSTKDARFKLSIPILTFLIIGFVDLGIIWRSFIGIGFKDIEAAIFAFPAIGIQLIFPHMIGDRIRSNHHGDIARKRNIIEIVTLTILWLTFVATMTQVRLEYLDTKAFNETGKYLSDSSFLIYATLMVLNFLMLVGLGSVLILLTANSNPHFRQFYRVQIQLAKKQKVLERAEIEFEEASNQLPILEFSHDVTKSSFDEASGEVNRALGKASKKVYRRALVNRYSDTDFTNAYLNSETKD
jgi:hypothetical protein